MGIASMIGCRGWIGARHNGVVAAVPVVVIFADPMTGKITCREEIGGGRHRDYQRVPAALHPTENAARKALGLPLRQVMKVEQWEQLEFEAVP